MKLAKLLGLAGAAVAAGLLAGGWAAMYVLAAGWLIW